jgi:type II secretory pathway component PulK
MGTRPAPGTGERGLALVIVLLVLSLLLAIVGEFATAMRLEGTTTLNFRANVAAAHLAEAGYQRALVELAANPVAVHLDEQTGLLVLRRAAVDVVKPPTRQDIALGPGRFSYRITDERARINPNDAGPDRLDGLLRELGVEKENRDVILDSVQDWRDPNEEHRLNGAESDYYLALRVPYKSKNAPLDSVEELLQVRGVTPRIFYGTPETPGLIEYLTVVSTGMNANTASDVVLRALNFAPAEIDRLKAGRPYFPGKPIPPDLAGRIGGRGGLVFTSTFFRIEATGEVPGQGRRTLRAIVSTRGAGNASRATLLAWQWVQDEASPHE